MRTVADRLLTPMEVVPDRGGPGRAAIGRGNDLAQGASKGIVVGELQPVRVEPLVESGVPLLEGGTHLEEG
jgi:hypothetical protein